MASNDLWTAEAVAAAVAFCREFEGTPHMPRRLKAGRGADCARFALGVHQAAGILPEFEYPTYDDNRGFYAGRNWMSDALCEVFFGEIIALDQWEPQTGDIGVFKVGKRSNHVAVLVNGRFWHVTSSYAVHHCSIDTVRERLQEIVRITAPGLRKPPVTLSTT